MQFLDNFQLFMRIARARRLPGPIPKVRLTWSGGLLLIWGTGNEVALQGCISGVVCLVGNHNRLVVAKGARLSGAIAMIGNYSALMVGQKCRVSGQIDIKGSRKTITIGEETSISSGRLLCQEGHSIAIGRRCALARGAEIRTTDAHAVIDRATGRRRNPGRAVQIGDRVRIGADVLVGKGAAIADGTVVEAGSLVIGTFSEPDTAISGVPARVIQRLATGDSGCGEVGGRFRPRSHFRERMERSPPDQTIAIEGS